MLNELYVQEQKSMSDQMLSNRPQTIYKLLWNQNQSGLLKRRSQYPDGHDFQIFKYLSIEHVCTPKSKEEFVNTQRRRCSKADISFWINMCV